MRELHTRRATAAERRRIAIWLEQHWTPLPRCPLCGAREWELSEQVLITNDETTKTRLHWTVLKCPSCDDRLITTLERLGVLE
jgi:hypothetical protein